MGLAVLVGCKDTVKAPEQKPEVNESVQEQETTVTTVDPTDVGELIYDEKERRIVKIRLS